MGAQYHQRIKMDKETREYYNKEVKALLGMKDTHKGNKEGSILHILRKAPWTLVPIPTTPLPTEDTRAHTRARTLTQAGQALGGDSSTVSRLLSGNNSSNSSIGRSTASSSRIY